MNKHSEDAVVKGFGREWSRFDQSGLSGDEAERLFQRYFSIFPWEALPGNSTGFDMGCGSGRWASFVAGRVGLLHLLDASSEAVAVARQNLASHDNCRFHVAGVQDLPLTDHSMDFGYCLGVLHHIPDTLEGLKACTRKLKPGAPFLLYLYYRLENRPLWFRLIWHMSNLIRFFISHLPFFLRAFLCDLIAIFIYWPLARISALAEKIHLPVRHFPLSAYRKLTLYSMRTDSLDRFGTRLEKRFTAAEIRSMMEAAGLKDIRFSDQEPFWVAVGYRATP